MCASGLQMPRLLMLWSRVNNTINHHLLLLLLLLLLLPRMLRLLLLVAVVVLKPAQGFFANQSSVDR